MKYQRLPRKDFLSIYRRVPRLCLELVVVTPKGLLLTERSIEPCLGKWHLPGGGLLFKEPIRHALARIARDELGVKIEPVEYLGLIEYINDCLNHTVGLAYLLKIKEGRPRGSRQGRKIGFFKKVPDNCIKDQEEFLIKNWKRIEKLTASFD